jgi:hypothetical protein
VLHKKTDYWHLKNKKIFFMKGKLKPNNKIDMAYGRDVPTVAFRITLAMPKAVYPNGQGIALSR